MTRPLPSLLGVARTIHKAIQQPKAAATAIELPESSWTDAHHSIQLLEKAVTKGWHVAAKECRDRLFHELEELAQEVERIQSKLQEEESSKPIPTVHDIYADLVALKGEFEDFQANAAKRLLSVNTEFLVLDDVELGRFRIELRWDNLKDRTPYKTVALDPNPSNSNPDVFHPHLQKDWLCEGNGQDAIRLALASGRLLDFFLLVRQILRTYNSVSAFVQLSDWESSECDDCGGLTDEIGACARCQDAVCGDCLSGCTGCEDSFCSSCMNRCYDCSAHTCHRCLSNCCHCHESFCTECLTDGICSKCEKKLAATPDAEVAVQPDGVCQTPVFA